MNGNNRNHNVRALVWFLAGLLLFLAAGVTLSAYRQRALLRSEADAHAQRELGLLASLLRDDLRKGDHAAMGRTLAAFADQHGEIHEVRIVAPDGSVPAKHTRSDSGRAARTHTREVEYAPGRAVTLEVVEDPDPIHRSLAALVREGVGAAILFTALMGGVLWFVLRRTALIPLEQSVAERTAALRKETVFISAVLDTVASIVCVLDHEGKIVRFNRACERASGYTFEEVEGRHVWDFLLPPEQIGPVKDVFANLSAGRFPNQYENHWLSRDGVKRLIAWSNTVLLNGDGTVEYIIATGIDITESRAAENAHRESEERYRLLFHRSPIGIFHYDPRLVITDCNEAFPGILRAPREKLIGVDMNALQDKRILPAHRAAASGNEGFYEGPYQVTASGADIWISLRTAPLFDSRGAVTGGVGIVEDITARKTAERALQEALQRAEEEQNKSEAIIAAIGDGISIQDRDFRVVYQNEFHKKMIGAHVGEYCYQAYEGREAVCDGCPVALSFQDGKVHIEERTGRTERGPVHAEITASPLRDGAGNIIAGIEVARNITERKRMEDDREKLIGELRVLVDAVSRSRKEWRDTFDSIQDPIYITDAAYRIVKANRAFTDFTGTGFPGVLGMKCHELLHDTAGPYAHCPYEALKETGKPVAVEIVHPVTRRSLMVSHFPHLTPEGGFAGSISIIRDITEERDKEMRFIMNERLASLGQMAASIAHEINNPLTAILGCADGLRSRVERERYDPALFRNYLRIIEEEIGRCRGITTGMLAFVRKSAPGKEAVNVHETIDRTLEIIGFQGRLKAVEVVKRFGPGSHAVRGNEGELKQVLLTLVTNALDAMEDRGVLTIETRALDGRVLVAVSDTGGGIPGEHITRIFDPFFTTKAGRGGTGLGLSIAKQILANHGGDIEAASEPGKGATFTITLPKH